ncbi:MAG: hypothetical protein ACO3AC_06995 [Hylemonella sp.]
METPSTTLYVMRNAQGQIVRLARDLSAAELAAEPGWQAASSSQPEVQAFLQQAAGEDNPLSNTDAGLARVTEDLIDVLIDRGVIQFTDLPPAAQAKLLERRETRAHLGKRLKLLADENGSADSDTI